MCSFDLTRTLERASDYIEKASNLELEIQEKWLSILELKQTRTTLLLKMGSFLKKYDENNGLRDAVNGATKSSGRYKRVIYDKYFNGLLEIIKESLITSPDVKGKKRFKDLMDNLARNEAAMLELLEEHNSLARKYNANYCGYMGRGAFAFFGATPERQESYGYNVELSLFNDLWGASELKAKIQEASSQILEMKRARVTLLRSIARIFKKYDETNMLGKATTKAISKKDSAASGVISDDKFTPLLNIIRESLDTSPDVKNLKRFRELISKLAQNEADIMKLVEKHNQFANEFNAKYCIFNGKSYYELAHDIPTTKQTLDYIVDKALLSDLSNLK